MLSSLPGTLSSTPLKQPQPTTQAATNSYTAILQPAREPDRPLQYGTIPPFWIQGSSLT